MRDIEKIYLMFVDINLEGNILRRIEGYINLFNNYIVPSIKYIDINRNTDFSRSLYTVRSATNYEDILFCLNTVDYILNLNIGILFQTLLTDKNIPDNILTIIQFNNI